MPAEQQSSLAGRVLTGLKLGAGYAVIGVVLAALHHFARGDGLYAELNLTFPEVLAMEIVGGLTAGAIGGALWPFARNAFIGAVIGIVATVPVAVLVSLTAFARPGRTLREFTIMGGLFAIAFGGAAGAGVFKALNEGTSDAAVSSDDASRDSGPGEG